MPTRPIMKLPPGRIAIIGTLVSIAAGVGEEIQFRLVSFAVLAWIASLFTSGPSGPSSRGALWFATIVQAYVFGLIHRGPANDLLRLLGWSHGPIAILVSGLLVPQTWIGIVLGRLYLKRGLEASMIAHATIDATLFMLLAIIRSLAR
jgi:membrane protease YdiL (CAAX protease family)